MSHSWNTLAEPDPAAYSRETRAVPHELRVVAIAAREESNRYRATLDTKALVLVRRAATFDRKVSR